MPKTNNEIEVLFKGTFETELGRRCLEHLKATFIDRPMYIQGLSLDQVAFKEGEASVIRKIIKEVKRDGRSTTKHDT